MSCVIARSPSTKDDVAILVRMGEIAPRGVYPERKFFDKLRMSGLRAQNNTKSDVLAKNDG